MEPYLAMQTAAALLGIAALGGLVMAGIRLKGAVRPPSAFAMGHGLLAGAALTLLIYFAATVGLPSSALLATCLLVLAAIGGVFINLRYHDRMQPLSVPWIIVHALIAVAGFALLLFAIVQGPPTA